MAAAEGSAEAFLAAHGLAAAADSFRAEGFDTAQQLVEARLTDADLRELGLAQMMPRKRLLNALSDEAARLGAQSSSAGAPSSAAISPPSSDLHCGLRWVLYGCGEPTQYRP